MNKTIDHVIHQKSIWNAAGTATGQHHTTIIDFKGGLFVKNNAIYSYS